MQLMFNPQQYKNSIFDDDLVSIESNKNNAIWLQSNSDIKSMICYIIKNNV